MPIDKSTVSVHAYECSLPGHAPSSIVHHVSRGKAKSRYFQNVCNAWSPTALEKKELYKKVSCQVLGVPVQTPAFKHTAKYRGLSFARIGMKVTIGNEGEWNLFAKCGAWSGFILDRNNSANFDVYFVDGPHAGIVLNCHPHWMMKYFNDDGRLIYDSAAAGELND